MTKEQDYITNKTQDEYKRIINPYLGKKHENPDAYSGIVYLVDRIIKKYPFKRIRLNKEIFLSRHEPNDFIIINKGARVSHDNLMALYPYFDLDKFDFMDKWDLELFNENNSINDIFTTCMLHDVKSGCYTQIIEGDALKKYKNMSKDTLYNLLDAWAAENGYSVRKDGSGNQTKCILY